MIHFPPLHAGEIDELHIREVSLMDKTVVSDQIEVTIQEHIEAAYKAHREDRRNTALEEISKAIDLLEKVYASKAQPEIRRLSLSERTELLSMQLASERARLFREDLVFELNAQVTVLAELFGFERLKADTYVGTRARALKMLGVEEGYYSNVLDRAKEIANEREELMLSNTPPTKAQMISLVEKGLVLDVEEFKGKSIAQWVEDIAHSLNNPEQTSLVESPNGDGQVNGSQVNGSQVNGNQVNGSQVNGNKISLSDQSLSNLVAGLSNQETDLINGLVEDSILNPENQDELKLIVLLVKDQDIANKVKNKDYSSFDEPETVRNIFDGVCVISSQQRPGLRERVVEFFKDKKKVDTEPEVAIGLKNFSNAFEIDLKIIEQYVASEGEPSDAAPLAEDIALAEEIVVSSLKNKEHSHLARTNGQVELVFLQEIEEEIGVINIKLEDLELNKTDLYVAKSFWSLKGESEGNVKSQELLDRVNKHLQENGLKRITLPELVNVLDKLNILCTQDKEQGIEGNKVFGISGDIFVLDITNGKKSESEKSIIKTYRKTMLRGQEVLYRDFIDKLKTSLTHKQESLEIILERKLRLDVVDFCLLTAAKLTGQEGNEKDLIANFNDLLKANDIKYELSTEDLQSDIERRVEKINSLTDNVTEPLIKVAINTGEA